MTVSPTSPFRALDQRRAFELIINQIEEAILVGKLRPGDRLPGERELADTFGVSRASVREALRVLEVFGVVVARAGNGPQGGSIIADGAVYGLTNALRLHAAVLQIPTRDIVDVRAVLESHSVRLAATQSDQAARDELYRIVDAMSGAESPDAFHQLDTEFHVALARASGNELLPVLMESLRGSIQQYMLQSFHRLTDWLPTRDRLIAQHLEIAQAVEAGDADQAATALESHIVGFYQQVMKAPITGKKTTR